MKKIIFLLFLFCQIGNIFSQETVKIVTYGSGKTYESALSIALRSSLEQAAGVFISNMAVVKNDSLIYDEVKSISNGTITKYDILAKVFDSTNAIHTLTIEAEIIPEKFISFAKGINNTIEFNGNAFIQNIKLNRLYKNNEPSILFQYLAQYFQLIDTNYLGLESLYMDGWYKLYDKNVKIIGENPFKYNFVPINIWGVFSSQYDSSAFKKMNWYNRRFANYFIADRISSQGKIYNKWLSQKITSIGELSYRDLSKIDFISKDFVFDSDDDLDSLFILHKIIQFYNEKFKIVFATQSDAYALGNPKYNGLTYDEATEYWYFRLNYWVDRIIKKTIQLNASLKKQDGKFVFNLQPELTPNKNYKLFISQLHQIFKAISVNKEKSFDKTAYEKNNDTLYSIYFIDLNSSERPIEYLVRNKNTYLLFQSILTSIHIHSGCGQIFYEKLLRTDVGHINTYISGFTDRFDSNIISYSKFQYNAIVINPPDQYKTVGVVENNKVNVRLRFILSMSAFFSEEEMSNLKKFVIVTPN